MSQPSKGSLAEQLQALLAYRNTPDHAPEPLRSNWSVVPANDNAATARTERLANEKLLKVTPSIEEILRNMREDWVWKDGRVVSIGRLRFSDGAKHEPGYVRGQDGKVERRMVRVPAGAVLGCTETLTEDAGGQPTNITVGNAEFCKRMGVEPRSFIPSGTRRRGKSYSPAQSKALIAEAIANTPVMPAVTVCPPGVASGTAQYSDQFNGGKIGSTGKGGLIHWVDLYMAGLEHEAWMSAKRDVPAHDRQTLDAAMTATSLASMGWRGHRRTRERQALKRLVAANDNYFAAYRKISA